MHTHTRTIFLSYTLVIRQPSVSMYVSKFMFIGVGVKESENRFTFVCLCLFKSVDINLSFLE